MALYMSLETLPSELIARICDYTNKAGLMALRLVNKRVSSLATRSFSKYYMQSVSSLMTRRSLDRLIAICEHSSFGPSVRRIHITSGRIHPGYIAEVASKAAGLLANDSRTQEQVVTSKLTLQRCLSRAVREYELDTSGKATELLARAFTALDTYNTAVTLHISSGVWTSWDLYHDTLHLDCDGYEGGAPFPDTCTRSTIQPCLDAIVRSRMTLTGLQLFVDDDSANPAERGFNLDSMNEEDFSVFSKLELAHFEAITPLDDSGLEAMAKVMSHANRLKIVSCAQDDDFGGDEDGETVYTTSQRFELSDNTLRSIKSDGITALSFENMPVSKDLLFNLLNKHRKTLENLNLHRCALRDGSWIDIIKWIKDNLKSLHSIEMADLYDAEHQANAGQYLTREPSVCGTPGSIVGAGKVQDALQTMIARPLFDPNAAAYDELMV